MPPKLSIITICRNEAPGIRHTADSLLAQTCDDFEWIVMDGGSTDGTLAILDRYLHRMTHFVTGPDPGVFAAMNQAAQLSQGQWLLFMNGGDALASPDSLATMLPHLVSPSDTVVVGGRICTWPDSRPPCLKIPAPGRLSVDHFYKRTVNHQSAFIGRPVFERFGPYDTSFRLLADYDFFARAALGGATFQCVPTLVARYDMSGITARMKGTRAMNRELRRIRGHYPFTYRLRRLAAGFHASAAVVARSWGGGPA